MQMKKLENYKRVALVNMNGKPYHFLIYTEMLKQYESM